MPRPDPRADIRNDRGAAVQSGASDLALVGAAPAAFAAAPVGAEPIDLRIAPASPGRGSDEPATETQRAAPATHDEHGASRVTGTDASTATTLTAPVIAQHEATPGTVQAEAPAAPHGSGGIAVYVPHHGDAAARIPVPEAGDHAGSPEVIAAPLMELASAGTASMAAPVDPAALDTIRASMAEMQDAIAALSDRLPAAATADVAQHAGQVLTDATDAVSALEDHVADVAAATTSAAAAVTDQVADIAGSATQTVAATVATVSDRLGETAAGAIDLVHDAVAPLAGSDPPAGITTLVGMVSAADVFDLHDAVSAPAGLAPALGAIGAADLLADVHPADSLLGIADHHGDLLGGLTDHDGLFGHG